MVLYISNARAVAACDNLVDAFDAGSSVAQARLLIYTGAVPADADAPLGGATLVATVLLNAPPSFGDASDAGPGATATMNTSPVPEDSSATGNISPVTFFRLVDRDQTVCMQGAISTSGAELNLNTTTISAGATVQITSMTVTVPES